MNSKNLKICALILAGGLSSRMSYQDKGLLKVKGVSFVERIAKQLQNQVSDIYVSSNNNQDAYQALGFKCINDYPFPSEGPLCAIAAGLTKIPCDYLLIVPCDSPYISKNICKELLWGIKDSNAKIACLTQEEKIEPLFSMINTSLAKKLKEDIEKGMRKTQKWIQTESHVLIESNSTEKYFNINTQDELNDFLEKENLLE